MPDPRPGLGRDDRCSLGDAGEGAGEPLAEGWLLRLRRATARPRPVLSLPFLGAGRLLARLDGSPVRLTMRHTELLVLLALHPEGLTAP